MGINTDLRDLAVAVATEAAELVARRQREGVDVVATKSSAIDVVTAADEESELLIRGRLLAARPGDGFLGEEGGDQVSESGVTWVVDPIDGTVNFLYGIPQYAVSIAARDADGVVLAGAVVNAATGHLFAAALGVGATCTPSGGEPVQLRVRDSGDDARQWLVATGFGYVERVRAAQGAAVARLLPRVRDIRRAGAAALDLCALAAGQLDGYVEEGVKPWDWSAAGLVATEAGARLEVVAADDGREAVVAAPAATYDGFRTLVAEAGLVRPR